MLLQEPPTPITQLFGGELQSQVRCLSCGHESNTVEVTLDLSLEVNGCKSIQQALQKFMAAEKLDGDNKYRCDRCFLPPPSPLPVFSTCS